MVKVRRDPLKLHDDVAKPRRSDVPQPVSAGALIPARYFTDLAHRSIDGAISVEAVERRRLDRDRGVVKVMSVSRSFLTGLEHNLPDSDAIVFENQVGADRIPS